MLPPTWERLDCRHCMLFLVGFRNLIFACLNSQSVAPTVGGVYLQMVSGIFIDRNIAPGQDACGVLQTKLCNYMQTFNTCTCKHIHITYVERGLCEHFYMHNDLQNVTLHKDTSGFCVVLQLYANIQ